MLLHLFVALLMLCYASQPQPMWSPVSTVYSNADAKFCASIGLSCINGQFDSTATQIDCSSGTFYCPSSNSALRQQWGYNPSYVCSCPNGYAGIQCDLATPQLCDQSAMKSAGLSTFDPSFYNGNAIKLVDCFMIYDNLVALLGLRENRVKVAVFYDCFHNLFFGDQFLINADMRTITFELWGRLPIPTTNMCTPLLRALQVNVSNCLVTMKFDMMMMIMMMMVMIMMRMAVIF